MVFNIPLNPSFWRRARHTQLVAQYFNKFAVNQWFSSYPAGGRQTVFMILSAHNGFVCHILETL